MNLSEDPLLRIPAPEQVRLQNRLYRCVSNHYRGAQQVQPHYHTESELILARAITGYAFAGGRKLRLDENRLLYFPANQVHSFQFSPQNPESTILCLQFDPHRFLPLLSDISEEGAREIEKTLTGSGTLSEKADVTAIRAFEELARKGRRVESAGSRGLLFIQAMMTLMIALNGKGPLAIPEKPANQDRLRLILDRIESGLERRMGLDELSHACGLSKFHLCRYFRKATGLTLQTYINRQKVLRAQRLMVEDGMNVNEAALASGLESVSYFVRLFRKHTGSTPKKWWLENRRPSGSVEKTS